MMVCEMSPSSSSGNLRSISWSSSSPSCLHGKFPQITDVSAALIIADKSDVRRSRVRNINKEAFDIHDRVNYAVTENDVSLSDDHIAVILLLTLDTENCSVLDYFEIFLNRMKLCQKAADFLHLRFKLLINGAEIC